MMNTIKSLPIRGTSGGYGPEAMNNVRKQYSTKSASWKAMILIIVVVAALTAVITYGIEEYLDRKAWDNAATVVYPMTNQHVTWTGAGYSGRPQ